MAGVGPKVPEDAEISLGPPLWQQIDLSQDCQTALSSGHSGLALRKANNYRVGVSKGNGGEMPWPP